MGLGVAFLRDLIELKRSGALNGANWVCEIGDQQLSDTLIQAPELEQAYSLFGSESTLELKPVGSENFTNAAPSSLAFWHALGFERSAIDIEGPAVKVDLNRDRAPRRMRGKFDFVVNAGTTEHVANQINAFSVIHELCATGGLMYHEVPAGGAIDHGLIAYNPKFFHRLAEANSYEVIFLRFSTHGPARMPDYLDCAEGAVIECALRVAMRKVTNRRFLPPTDR